MMSNSGAIVAFNTNYNMNLLDKEVVISSPKRLDGLESTY